MSAISELYTCGHNIWNFSIFYQIFFSPQLKRIIIISNENGIIELPLELANDLYLGIIAYCSVFFPKWNFC